jgi:RNA polymerase sigma-70 factor, ECF subfamily
MCEDQDNRMQGPLEARYLAYLETLAQLRPSLHRYCSRMVGSALDGEDVVQEALLLAYRKLDTADSSRPLGPWLFRIAHNCCIDFLRHREVRMKAEAASVQSDQIEPTQTHGLILGRAVEYLVLSLPPKERACVLLKDVFEYSLEEIADLLGATVGSVKSALNRGRSKMATIPASGATPLVKNADKSPLLHLYVKRFNDRDWDGLRDVILADARVHIVDRFAGRLLDSPYFGRYETSPIEWRMAVGEVDGELVVIMSQRTPDGWSPKSAIRIAIRDDRIIAVVDYLFCPWLIADAQSVSVLDPPGIKPSGYEPEGY